MNRVIRVSIICLNRVLREGLTYELSQHIDIDVGFSASDVYELLKETWELDPNIIITDLSSIDRDKIYDMQQLCTAFPESKILIIGLSQLESEFIECIEAGASGCLSHDASLEDLHNHIRAVNTGGALCSPSVTKFLFDRIAESARDKDRIQALNLIHLTRREREVIALIEKGCSNKEIATHLKIELQTVKNHVHKILEKLKLSNRREAAKYVREKGLIRNLNQTFNRPAS